LRNLDQRREAAARFGGTVESEAAVELSLKWLSAMQSPDGHWDAETHGSGLVRVDENGVVRNNAGRDADTGITALVTLSFLGAGYTHESGRHAISVDRALDWLISQQDSEGSLAGEASHYANMYCHAMATYALAEALGMQTDVIIGPIVDPVVPAAGPYVTQQLAASIMLQQGLAPHLAAACANRRVSANADSVSYGLRRVDEFRLRAALLKAVTYTISQQDPKSGGWRYRFGQEGDVSMFGWQMMSLKSAAIAGVSINPTVRQRMIEFLNSVRQGGSGGLFGYRRSVIIEGQETEPVTPVMTAEALFCQQMLGYPRESVASREAVQYLLRNLPRLSQLNMYYWYYGTLAMYQYGGQPWEDWNSVVRDTLISQQRRDGQLAGSWDPNGPWGRYGGRLYSTAISTMTLEVYYRLLPLYRMNEDGDK
ncbi:MAG: terpene cyclase/mutase family protein, partial [Fuerstiella sp.]|nr:terpene cyclase/mutase family protein [Fuerstiella sp.]